ncbi:MAG: lipoate--protein ligase family protein [Promethearchaeota archaeon]
METWRLIPFRTYDGYTNMAIDEILLNRVITKNSPNILRFYQWDPTTATIGRNQSLSAEIDMDFTHDNNVQVVRRITGGGAVLHSHKNEITYSVIAHTSAIPPQIESPRHYDSNISQRYIAILEALAQGLEQIGYPIDVGAIHCPALLTQGKKISGNAQLIRQNVILQHGTILLEVNPEFMYSVLRAPTGVKKSKMVQSVRSKVTGLHSPTALGEDSNQTILEDGKIVQVLQASFERIFQIRLEIQPLDHEELMEVAELVKTKYNNTSWLEKHP